MTTPPPGTTPKVGEVTLRGDEGISGSGNSSKDSWKDTQSLVLLLFWFSDIHKPN